MGAVASFVGDVVEGVGDVVGDVVEVAGDALLSLVPYHMPRHRQVLLLEVMWALLISTEPT